MVLWEEGVLGDGVVRGGCYGDGVVGEGCYGGGVVGGGCWRVVLWEEGVGGWVIKSLQIQLGSYS